MNDNDVATELVANECEFDVRKMFASWLTVVLSDRDPPQLATLS